MNRITASFAARHAAGRTALVFYLTAGDPSIPLSVDLLHALVAGGADLIELGYPFCDPILDGPVIRLANRRALDAGGSLDATLDIVRRFRERDAATPIILMGYANPVMSRGAAIFGIMAMAGADGMIVPDLPLREVVALLPAIAAADLLYIPLVPPDELADVPLLSEPGIGGFTYCIAQAGPTGGAEPAADRVAKVVARCREIVDRPVGVGFGIRTPASAALIADHADAVIVGSVLVDLVWSLAAAGETRESLLAEVTAFAARFRQAIDG